MFDFRIAYSGFAGLNFVFTRVLERFARKLIKIKTEIL